MSVKSFAKRLLTEKENKRYERCLAARKVCYSDWLREQERRWREEACAERTEDRGSETSWDECRFVLIYSAAGEPADYAAKSIARYFKENPETFVVYGDEDILNAEGKADFPWFKPDWSPDFLDSCFYVGSLVAVRREHWQKLQEHYEKRYPGRLQEIFKAEKGDEVYRVADTDAYEQWFHDCVREGYEKSSRFVGHIPQILFHAESKEAQVRFLRESAYLQSKRQELLRGFREEYAGEEENCNPAVSVVIPSRDHPDILRQCVESVRTASADISAEIIVVDNGSNAENKTKIMDMMQEVAGLEMNGGRLSIRYLYEPMEFNFSRMCNRGAGEARGKFLLFLNDDVVLEDGCVGEMAARAERCYTGAVGLKLLYPDNGLIQHAGITNLPMGPVHKLQFQKDDCDDYGKVNHCCRNFLAVTAACLMVEKKKFWEAGGFSEELKVAFNDVDLCFQLYELGYHNACLNDIYARHHESLSRGADESEEKLARLLEERDGLYRRHPKLEGRDPYYSVFLNREGLDTGIRPAYETAGNRLQQMEQLSEFHNIEACRQDECLMVRVEDCRNLQITGYSIILGDNNACYKKLLLLREEDGRNEKIFSAPLEAQYRPDLEENLPDQIHVSLSGFFVKLKEGMVPAGRYRIGVMAESRIGGCRLVNWSNRFVEL